MGIHEYTEIYRYMDMYIYIDIDIDIDIVIDIDIDIDIAIAAYRYWLRYGIFNLNCIRIPNMVQGMFHN